MREQDLYNQLLNSDQAPAEVDLSTLPSQQDCEQIFAEIRAIRAGLGITRLQASETLQLVAVSRGADWASDDAYARFLATHPEIAEETFVPSVFALLGSTAASFGSLEEAAEELALQLLQACADLGQRSRADCERLVKGLEQPLDKVILPGYSVADARAMFGEVIKVGELQINLAEGRSERTDRLRQRVAGALEEAKEVLEEEEAIARLRMAAQKDEPLPLPEKGKSKGKNGKPRTVAKTKRRFPMSQERRPARGTPQQIRDGARRLGAVRKLIRLKIQGVTLDRFPRDAGDSDLRSIGLAASERADDPDAVAMARALGVDLVVLRDVLARQGSLWNAFLLVRAMLRDGRAARRLTDAARRLARAHVDATVAARRVGLDSDAQALLDDDLEEITTLKDRAGVEVREHATKLAGIEQQAREQLQDLDARRGLLKTLASLRHGSQELVWADLSSAASTLEHLAGKGAEPDLQPRKSER